MSAPTLRRATTVRDERMPRTVVVAYLVAGMWLAAYVATLLLRHHGQFWSWLDNWSVDAFEVTVALLCLSRFLLRRPGRSVGLAFGLGLLAWAIGDIVFTLESQGGASPPTPSLADAFYLIMYPLAYLGIMLIMRGEDSYQSGTILDASWMTALFLLSLTVWQRVGARRSDDDAHAPGFVLPAVAGVSAVTIIFVGNWMHISSVALGLTVATLALVGVRAGLSRGELNALTRANHHHAVTDELTGLGNRRLLTRELDAIFATPRDSWRPDESLALLMIDLDHFKEINDSFGHPTGDGLLRLIGPRLSSVTRSSDVVVRLGGDEFAVLLTGADVDFAMAIAERITTEIEPPFDVEGSCLHVGASIGIALAPQHAGDATELMRCADVAMYRAKAAHSPYDIYESALDDGADRLNLMEDLRAAIADQALTVYYQPQVDLRSGEVTTLEALLRWSHPVLGFIPPDQFIPLAEESGLMWSLTTFVLETAIAQCAEWRRGGRPVAVAVNLSTTNLLDSGLPGQIHAALDRHGLGPDALVLEITESTVMADLARCKEIIQTLSDSGLVISIDDFGTGFSSLAYLSDLAVGELKIDRMFTARLSIDGVDGRNEAIIRSSIELGHSLGLRVVAEGVERSDHFGFLATAGCDVAQGYAISFPAPPEELDFAAIDDRAAPMLPAAHRLPATLDR